MPDRCCYRFAVHPVLCGVLLMLSGRLRREGLVPPLQMRLPLMPFFVVFWRVLYSVVKVQTSNTFGVRFAYQLSAVS